MLNLQNKLSKFVFAILVFSMVAFSFFAHPSLGIAKEADAKGSTIGASSQDNVAASKSDSEKEKDATLSKKGEGSKSITIDFSKNGKKGDFAKRSIRIWKVSDGIKPEESGIKGAKDFQAVVSLLEKESEASLDSSYTFHKLFETDGEGKLKVTLPKGTYYLRMTEKSGITSVFPFVFVVDPEDSNSVIFPKEKLPTEPGVELLKISTDRVPLPGAVFQLFRLENKERVPVKGPSGGTDFVTDDVGKIKIKDLPPGNYVFVETQAPRGYRIKHPEVPFEVKDQKVTTVTVVNYQDKEGGKRFKKVSSKDGAPLSGAQFLVTKKTEKGYMRMKKRGKDMVLTSGSDGFFTADGLPDGEYYLWEVKAPKGFEPLSNGVKFIVSADSLKNDLIIKNNPQGSTPPGSTPPGSVPPGKTPPYDDKHVKIPKTGDVHLLLMSISGLLSGLLGVKILKDNE